MLVDHIFIFSSRAGKEADDLIHFGFTEGSSRVHIGQGTINRKFYVDNFFLEILWVCDETEIQSKITSKTKLWERSQFLVNHHSPFGLCFVNTKDTDTLFNDSEIYQPHYFPKGMSIDFISNETQPQLPLTFRLPYRGKQQKTNEPRNHANGIQTLTKVTFGIVNKNVQNNFTNFIESQSNVHFETSNKHHLTLEFDNHQQGKEKNFRELNLTILY